MGPCRDVIGELRDAAEKRGLTLCTSSHRAEHYWFFGNTRKQMVYIMQRSLFYLCFLQKIHGKDNSNDLHFFALLDIVISSV